MEAKKIIGYFVVVLLAVVLFSALATQISNNIIAGDYGKDSTGERTQTVLSDNGTITTLTLTDDAEITSLVANRTNFTVLLFDGDDDYVINTSAWTIPAGTNHTIIVWYNRLGNSTQGQNLIESFWGISPVFLCDTTGHLQLYVPGFDSVTKKLYCEAYNNIWTMYTWNYNGSHYLGYINGSNLVNMSAGGAGGAAWKGFEVGGRSTASRGVNGSIAQVRAYNRTLTNSELDEVYSSGVLTNYSLPTTGLVLWLKFDEATGTAVHPLDEWRRYTTHASAISGAAWVNSFNVTLTEGTDYTLSSDQFTLINEDLSWTGIFVNLNEAWSTSYGFHLPIIKILVGFVCLIVLIVATGLAIKSFKER